MIEQHMIYGTFDNTTLDHVKRQCVVLGILYSKRRHALDDIVASLLPPQFLARVRHDPYVGWVSQWYEPLPPMWYSTPATMRTVLDQKQYIQWWTARVVRRRLRVRKRRGWDVTHERRALALLDRARRAARRRRRA